MRIEYGCSSIGYGACYIEYAGTPALAFDYPSGIPETMTPAQTTTFDVVVSGVGPGVPVSGSGQLHYSLNSGIVQTVSMTEVSTNQYQAVLPATSCGDLLEYYVSAEEVFSGRIYDPDPVSPNKAVPVTGIVTVLDERCDTDPGWTTEGLWAFGQPTGGGGAYGGPDPTSGYTGNNVYGYNLNGDYENNLAEQNLTTPAIDCSGLVNVHLKFWRWLGVENSVYDHAYVRVSNDGTTWTTVWQNVAEYADDAWHAIDLNISDIADGQSIVYIRWTMGETDGGWTFCGWNIDDILITAYECGEQADSDEDGIPDLTDNCPAIPNPYQEDTDVDDIGDACDECTDTDNDGYGNPGYAANTCPDDNCPDVANPDQTDADADGIGDACDECTDTDSDGYGNPGYASNTCPDDNCPDVANPDQTDADADGIGDTCDECFDTDSDGYGDPDYPANTCPDDNCPDVSNPDQTDTDADGIGDACDECTDTDNDGYGNPGYAANTCPDDNCPDVANPEQTDTDADAIGDTCDECTDTDSDGYGNPGYAANTCPDDNCPDISNPDQTDTDGDNIGDACCCIGIRGNANADEEETLNIADVTFLVAYCFGGGPMPDCPAEGNVNADPEETINIADITVLVSYCFGGGPSPASCP